MFHRIAIMAVLLVWNGVNAQTSIHWMTWEEGVAAHNQNGKPIFVDLYTDWCGWCKHMDKNTFADTVIAKYMNKYYNNVKFNAERVDTIIFNGQPFINENPGSGRRSAHQLAVALLDGKMSYPSYAFIGNPWNKSVVAGYQSPQDFEKILRYFVEGAPAGMNYEQFLQQFRPISR